MSAEHAEGLRDPARVRGAGRRGGGRTPRGGGDAGGLGARDPGGGQVAGRGRGRMG